MSAVRIMPVSPKIESAHARKHENSPRPWCPLCVGTPAPSPAPAEKAPARTRKAPAPTPVVKPTPQVPVEVSQAAAVLSEFAQKYQISLTGDILRALAQAGVRTQAPAPKRTRKAPVRKTTPAVSKKSVLDGNVEWADGDVLVAVA